MPGYYCCHIGHAAVAHLYVILVAYLVQTVMKRKVLSKQAQKFSANVGFHIFAKWWVKPHNVLFSGFPRFTYGVVFILQFTRMLTSSHCLNAIWDCFGKLIAIPKEKRQMFGRRETNLARDLANLAEMRRDKQT